MLIPKETHSAEEETIALRWGVCHNLHVEFRFLRQTGSNSLCIYLAGSSAIRSERAGKSQEAECLEFHLH